MVSPIVGGIIALAAAAVVTAANRQFSDYLAGKRTYVGRLEGRPILALLVIIVIGAAGSMLISILSGSRMAFFYMFGAFVALGVIVLVIGLRKNS